MHNYLRMCKKSSTFVADYEKSVLIHTKRRDARVVEEARLESV